MFASASSAIQQLQGLGIRVLPAGDFGHAEVGRRARCGRPGRAGESLAGRAVFALRRQGHTQVIKRLAVHGCGVAGREPLEGFPKAGLGGAPAGLFEHLDPQGRVHPDVCRIAAQCFFPVRLRIERGVVELLDAQAGEVELLGGLDLARRRRVVHRAGLRVGTRGRGPEGHERLSVAEHGLQIVRTRSIRQGNLVDIGMARVDGHRLLEHDLARCRQPDSRLRVGRRRREAEPCLPAHNLQVHRGVKVRVLHPADGAEGIPVHRERPRLERLEPGIVWLVV